MTAEKIETQLTQSVTLFESGSTIFGDTSDDIHQFSGSVFISGSFTLNANNILAREISNDASFTDDSGVAVVTENALKSYLDNNTNDVNAYLRKCFAVTGSFVSANTASFSAYTASAPSGITSTSENDFTFFLNGQMMEHTALTIEQSGTNLLLKVDNDSIGYDLSDDDEIVAWGKFAGTFNYLDFDGSNDEVTTNFSGSNATPQNLNEKVPSLQIGVVVDL